MGNSEVQIGSLLETGDLKPSNQDNVLYIYDRINKHDVGLFVVADGMGGLAFGEEVSNLVVTFFNRWWHETLYHFVNRRDSDFNKINWILEEAVVQVNNLAVGFSKQVDQKAGSTLSLLLIVGNRYFIKNVGDSRIYIIRNNEKTQLTKDQSLVAQMVRNGEITEEEAKNHRQRNVLTMCLGVFEEVRTFSAEGIVKPGDVFLLCSDGFYNYVDEEEIVPIINNDNYKDLNQKALLLRSKIPAGNAKDNVSILLVSMGKKKPFMSQWLIITAIIIIMMAVIFMGVDYYLDSKYLQYLTDLVEALWK